MRCGAAPERGAGARARRTTWSPRDSTGSPPRHPLRAGTPLASSAPTLPIFEPERAALPLRPVRHPDRRRAGARGGCAPTHRARLSGDAKRRPALRGLGTRAMSDAAGGGGGGGAGGSGDDGLDSSVRAERALESGAASSGGAPRTGPTAATMLTTDAPQIIEHVNRSLDFTPYETKWIPSSARFVVLGMNPRGTGALRVYELDVGEAKVIHEAEKPEGLKCGTFGASALEDRHLATGDFKGRLSIFDLERPERPVYSVAAHSALINSIDGCGGLNIGGGAPELVTCSRDGTNPTGGRSSAPKGDVSGGKGTERGAVEEAVAWARSIGPDNVHASAVVSRPRALHWIVRRVRARVGPAREGSRALAGAARGRGAAGLLDGVLRQRVLG